MCGMCGLWTRGDRWADVATLPGGRAAASRRNAPRDRQLQADTISRFTRASGAGVRDWGGDLWIVENQHGGSEIVGGLGEVWQAVERLTGRAVDPLDLGVVQAFERSSHG